VATANALAARLTLVSDTVHCQDDEPEDCARRIAVQLKQEGAPQRVGLVGLNPAIAEGLVTAFGVSNITITDRDPDIIGTSRFGVEILDGQDGLDTLIERSDVALITGTTLVNGTWNDIQSRLDSARVPFHVFGVTGAAACALAGLSRLCPCAHIADRSLIR